jgi:carbamoyltransferase
MKLLSLRLCEHDSNISYFDGEKLHYYKSERTLQIKHHGFNNLWEWRRVIKQLWNLDPSDLDEIAIVLDPWAHNLPCDNEDFFPSTAYDYFPAPCPVSRINHHLAHSLSTWIITDREPDISFVFDGFGDHDVSWTVIRNNQIIDKGSLTINGSLGTELAQAGRHLGVTADNGLDLAGKVMGLQSYGKIDTEYLKFLEQFDMYSIKQIFDLDNWLNYTRDPTLANLKLLDWISTVHYRCGQVLLDYFSKFADSDELISYTGGVAQNVIWNTVLKNKFKNLIVPPHCADDGLSLGSIEWLRRKHHLPKFKLENFPYCQTDHSPIEHPTDEIIKKTAEFLSQGKIVAWYQGNGEIGPRALGNRSILMDPRLVDGKDKINQIKNREFYRPFGASILQEFKNEYFHLDFDNPYMLYIGFAKKDYLNSITHVDGTCRVQTVGDENIYFRKLLQEFFRLTDCPVLLNTSLNLAGKPISGYPDNALELFDSSKIDILIIGNTLYHKYDLPYRKNICS